jgi:ribosome-associated protein
VVEISRQIQIPETELTWSFVRASGPGGQNVNKVASKAELRWNVVASPSISPEVKARLLAQQRRRITAAGELVLTSQRYRDQPRNREDCLEKLGQIVLQAVAVPRSRKQTKPTRGSREARRQAKKHRAAVKRVRRRPADE